MRFPKAFRYGSIGVFFAGILGAIQGCNAEELFRALLVILALMLGAGGESETSDKGSTSTTPSVTTDPATNITGSSVTLNGTVNANGATTTVTYEYGTTTFYGTTVTADQSPVTGASNTAVSKTIAGLSPGTTYHYRVVGINVHGTVFGADMTFTTPLTPTVTTNAATSVTRSSVTLNGTVNANGSSTTVTFEYGTTIHYGTTVTADQSPVTGSSSTAVSKAGLSPEKRTR